MSKCDTCGKQKYGYLCDGCVHDESLTDKWEPMTNADHIRAMTDEELAEWIDLIDCYNCACCVHQMNCRFEHDTETVDYMEKYNCIAGHVDWLKQPYEEEV